MGFPWFEKELRNISSDLRLVRDPSRLFVDLWIIERRIPSAVHAELLKQAHEQGISRFEDKRLDDGRIVKWDRVPEWCIGHICRDTNFDLGDSRTYREPSRSDLDAIKRWLFEYKNAEEQIRDMHYKRTAREQQIKADGRREVARNVVMKFGRKPKTVDFGAKDKFKKKGKLWLPLTVTTGSKT